MPDVSMPWGAEDLGLSLPDRWTIQQTATPSLRPAPEDWPERMALALSQPMSGPPLSKLLAARRNGSIVLIVEDLTRHSPLPQILKVVLREIRHAGMADEQLEIFIATGMHPPLTPAEQSAKLGAAADGIARRSNPWSDPSQYVTLGRVGKMPVQVDRGVAEADLRIIISSVSPHLQAGFGGGHKMLFPGCASLETIRALHRLGIGRRDRQLVGTEAPANPMRAAIDAAGTLLDTGGSASFAVQYLLDDNDNPAAIASGDVIPAQQTMAKQCSVSCGILLGAPADVLIVGAYPRDFDLWQSFKCIANTRWALRPNGVVICLARCEAGLHGMKPPPWPIDATWTRRIVRLLGAEAISSIVTRLVPRLAGDAAFFVRLAAQTLHRNPLLLVSPALHATGAKFPGLELFAKPEDAIAAAQSLLGRGPQRAVVFPAGGTTYPIPAGMARGEQPPGPGVSS